MSLFRLAPLIVLGLCFPSCPAAEESAPATGPRDNVLVIIVDDVGREKFAAYGVHPEPAFTPHIDALSQNGVTFERFYTQPLCSPTRAAMLTGQQAFRTGVSTSVPWKNCHKSVNGCFEWDVDDALTLPRALSSSHATAAFGKWHLGVFDEGRGYMHPIRTGFDLFEGAKQNLGGAAASPSVFFEWEKNIATSEGAQQVQVSNYATTENVDDTLRFVERMDDEPWFAWVAFNAAHTPFHAPPAELAPVSGVSPDSPAPQLAKAMVEAMDTEIGRLLAGLRPAVRERTWIVFLCDNGTAFEGVQPPYPPPGQAKPLLFEANIRMPMVVVGPGLVGPGRKTEHLVHAVDIYATVCEMAGVPVPAEALDSLSFLDALENPDAAARRDVVLSERATPNGPPPHEKDQFAVIDGRWKWARLGEQVASSSPDSFFDLHEDPNEQTNLLEAELSAEQAAALAFLMQRREQILDSHGGGL